MAYLQSKSPKLFIVYDSYYSRREQAYFLICKVGNKPVGKLARCLNIYRRTAESVSVRFSIQNAETNQMIATDIKASDYMLSIPPSNHLENCFEVVKARDSFVKCVDHCPYLGYGQNIDLPIGKYLIIIKIDSAGKKIEDRKKFSVGSKKEDLCWESM